MDREYKLDEANKKFTVIAKDEKDYGIEDFKKLEKNLKESIDNLKRTVENYKKYLETISKVPNKEKLLRHRKEHESITKLEEIDKVEHEIKKCEDANKEMDSQLEEITPKLKILEDLDAIV